MSIAEQWIKDPTINVHAMIFFFLLSITCDAWGKQWHMVAVVVGWMIWLGSIEGLSIYQTTKTVSQNQVIWQGMSVRDYWLSWIAQYSKVSAMICFILHMK